jgi:aspartate/methionine/tyrosine aminotransferase
MNYEYGENMLINPQAAKLNDMIRSVNPYVFSMLSEKGQNIFFPKRGILSQTAEANGKNINATIGTALEDSNDPMCLDSIARQLNTADRKVFSYAPSFGRPEIRSIWKRMLFEKNKSLKGASISLPIVTSALTHGLSMAGYLFIDPGDHIIMPDLYWENYDLVFSNAYSAVIDTFPMFVDGAFNITGLEQRIYADAPGKKIILLNFPNNPTGYTVTNNEAFAIRDLFLKAADDKNNIVVFIDDAYFGLVFKEDIIKESLFALLANAHERILAVKFDGPTKEDFVWGFRAGFITFGSGGNNADFYAALESKLAGCIRGNISNSSNIAQSLLIVAYADARYEAEKTEKAAILKKRFEKIREILDIHTEYEEVFTPLPFNSGYFMCLKIKSGDAEPVRQVLLKKYDTGVIAQGDLIRVAFSSTPYKQLDLLMNNIYNAAKEVAQPK